MDAKNISILFNTLGISPNFKGYPYLIHVVRLASGCHGQPFPLLKDLYDQTGIHFGVSSGVVAHDIRTLLRVYWSRNNKDTFSGITHYPVKDCLTIKEFVSVVAEYLVNQS